MKTFLNKFSNSIFRQITVAQFGVSLVICFGISSFMNNFLLSWLGRNPSASISFTVTDGWCSPETEGIGKHCFGDFYYPLSLAGKGSPWSGELNPYPPFANFIFRIFAEIERLFQARISLVVYLVIIATALIFPLWHLTFRLKLISKKVFCLLLPIALFSAPAGIVLDRGNIVGLSIPCLYLFFLKFFITERKYSYLYFLILVNIKPQFIILGLVTIFTFLASFILYPSHFFSNASGWLHQLLSYQNYGSFGVLYPVNISTANSLGVFARLTGFIPLHHIGGNFPKVIGNLTILFYIILLMLVWKFGNRENYGEVVTSIFLLPIVLITTSFHYYLSVLLIFSLILIGGWLSPPFRETKLCKEITNTFFGKRFNSILSTILLISTLVPWAIPWNFFIHSKIYNGQLNSSVSWLISQLSLSILVIYLLASIIGDLRFKRISRRHVNTPKFK